MIYSPQFNMRIAAECTAITPTIVLVAAIIAIPTPVRSKLRGILLGASVLYFINLAA